MNILEIIWVLFDILGVFCCVKMIKEKDEEYLNLLIFLTLLNTLCIIHHFREALITPLW